MLKKIESLRKQPQYVRNRYAFWTAFMVTLLIAVLWGSTIPARFKTPAPVAQEKPVPSEVSTYTATMRQLLSGVIAQFGTITAEQGEEEPGEKRVDLVELVASTTSPIREIPTLSTTTTTSAATATPDAFLQASSSAQGN